MKMNSIHWISILAVSSLASISGQSVFGQSDLVSNETSVVSQWVAPIQVNGLYKVDQVRPVRRVNLNMNNSPDIVVASLESNRTTMRSSPPFGSQRTDSSPPYADHRNGMFNSNVTAFRKISAIGPTPNNNQLLRSNFAGYYGYQPGPYNNHYDAYGGKLNDERYDALTIAFFKKDKCEGSDKEEYTVQLFLPMYKLCSKYIVFDRFECKINTITSKESNKHMVNKFQIIFCYIDDKGGHKIVLCFGFIYSGPLAGKYAIVKTILEQWQVAHKCGGGIYNGPSYLQSDAAKLIIFDANPEIVTECCKRPPFCLDKVRSSTRTECQGTATICMH